MEQAIQALYLLSAIGFIFSLRWMNDPTTARRGVAAGVIAMVLAVGGTMLHHEIKSSEWILVAMVANATATLVASAVGLRALGGRKVIVGNDLLLLAVGAGLAGLFVFVDATWVLAKRWRSLPSIERLRDGLASSLRWLFGLLGALALGWFGAAALAPPPPPQWAGFIEVGIVALPVLMSFVALQIGVRRASRVS